MELRLQKHAGALGRSALSQAIVDQVGATRTQSRKLVDGITERIGEALERGEYVKIPHFGTFIVLDKAERYGRNPATGQEYPILSRRVVSFRPADKLRDMVMQVGTGGVVDD